MADAFGGIARGWGPRLTKLAKQLHERHLPLLPVIVVSKGKTVPSAGADYYASVGLISEGHLRDEQQRCFNHDWTTAPFWESSE